LFEIISLAILLILLRKENMHWLENVYTAQRTE